MLRVVPVLGSLSKRINALNKQADVYVINRENVQWLVEYYKNDWPFDMVVIDELSSFKNPSSKRFKALKCVRGLIHRIVGLTGTPAPNGLMDLWAQVYLLDQGQRLEKTITKYKELYFRAYSLGNLGVNVYEEKKDAERIIKNKISDICISLKAEDYLKLPEKIIDTKYVKLDSKAQKAYKDFERDMFLQIDSNTIDVATAAGLSNKLLQFCNGAVYGEDRQVVEIHDSKIEALVELLEALQGKPALVFYNFQHDRDRIKKALAKMKLKMGELKTNEDIARWNNKELDILLAHPASAAYGLNLQDGGSHVIWFGLNWSLELYQQANARLYRQGQKETVFMHHLVTAGAMDETVIETLNDKNATQDKLLNALKARIKEVQEIG